MATDREVFQQTSRHHRPDRILYRADFTEDLQRRLREHIGGEDIAAHYGLFEHVEVPVIRPDGVAAPDYRPYWDGQDLPEGSWINGIGVLEVPSGFYHFTGYVSPLRNAKSLSEMEDYPLDDLSEWDLSYMAETVAQAHAAGQVAGAFVGHMYETAWQIRGYEPFLMDMVERPAWAQCLLDRLAEHNRARALAFARAGLDLICCGDDVANQKAMMFNPRMWREMIHSRWAGIWRQIKEINPDTQIWYHSDGNIGAIVGELVEAGLDILNPLQPECLDVDAIHRAYGRRLTLDGTIGTQSTMPFGSPDDVRARVREVIDKYGRDGGLIISPTHVLEPDVPIENVEALFQACRDFGSFASGPA